MKKSCKINNENTSSDTSTKINEKKDEINNKKNAQDDEINIDKERGDDSSSDEDINNDEDSNNSELIKQLGILNVSIDTLHVILIAVILNINFVKGEKAKLLDAINETNFAENSPDLSDTPRITNIMFLYATGVFLDINYNTFREVSSVKGKNRNPKAIRRAWKSFISSVLNLISVAISRDNLEV